jgi:hypothetical protein
MNEHNSREAYEKGQSQAVSARKVDKRTMHAFTDSVSIGPAQLDLSWEITAAFSYPDSFTDDEQRVVFAHLYASHLRTQCVRIVQSLPDDVLPSFLPQLEELAAYEMQMWFQHREIARPNIEEDWVLLPARG